MQVTGREGGGEKSKKGRKVYICRFCSEGLCSILCNRDLRSGLLPYLSDCQYNSDSLAHAQPLFKQNGAVPAVAHKTNWQFRYLLLLWRNEASATHLNKAEPRLEPQPLTAQLRLMATVLWPVWGGQAWNMSLSRYCLFDRTHMQNKTILFPKWYLQVLVDASLLRGVSKITKCH